MDVLTQYFLSQGIPADEVLTITTRFELKQILKNDHFVEEAKTSKYLGFVTEGWFQYYYLREGKELTTFVSGGGSFLCSVSSFFLQKPSLEYIRAITDTSLYVISHTALQELKNTSTAFRSFYIGALEHLVTAIDQTRTNLIILSAEERYALLLEQEPKLLQQIPLQYLATILGVTPRHLSRIRGK